MNDTLKPFILTPYVLIGGLVTFFLGLLIWGSWHDEWSGYTASLSYSSAGCNVAVVSLTGEMVAGYGSEGTIGGDDVVDALEMAAADDDLIGVVLEIDSYGGAPSAGEVIANALQESPLPSVALIREAGVSAAYLAATGADRVYASEFSDVGGIGVTMSYLEYVRQNEESGATFISLTSAPYKDYGNPNKELTEGERSIIERDLSIFHEAFVRQVTENRGLPLETVSSLADGTSVPGELALDLGLIDELGVISTTATWLAEQADIDPAEVVFCS